MLKTVWALIGPKGGSFPVFPADLWNEIHSEHAKPGDFKTRDVTVDVTSGSKCIGDYPDGTPVPLDCFYHSPPLTDDDIKATHSLLVRTVCPGTLTANSYLVLVAVHVTTKEISDWVWATFWWNNKSAGDWHSSGRPQYFGPTGSHYLMDTTLSGTTPVEQDGGPKIIFNPFLEAESRMKNGIISNCLQCHSKAAFGIPPNATTRTTAYLLGVLGRDGQRLASGIRPYPEYFDDVATTDFLWSIADAFDGKSKQIVRDLQSRVLPNSGCQ